jgi:hypothetical protein
MPCLLAVGWLLRNNNPTAAEARRFHYISQIWAGRGLLREFQTERVGGGGNLGAFFLAEF